MCKRIHHEHNWNEIYARRGNVFVEPLDEVKRFSEKMKEAGLSRVLDLGCGNGRHTVFLDKKGFDIWGLDNAPEGIRLAHVWLNQEHLVAPLVLADVHAPFPFKDNSFDGLISTRVIHHATQAKVLGAVREIIRVVHKGGMILITVPGDANRKSHHAWFGRHTLIKWIDPQTYVPLGTHEKGIPHYVFTPEELMELFSGFAEVKIEVGERNSIVLTARK
jgi:SAM-dependent methyltransferase